MRHINVSVAVLEKLRKIKKEKKSPEQEKHINNTIERLIAEHYELIGLKTEYQIDDEKEFSNGTKTQKNNPNSEDSKNEFSDETNTALDNEW